MTWLHTLLLATVATTTAAHWRDVDDQPPTVTFPQTFQGGFHGMFEYSPPWNASTDPLTHSWTALPLNASNLTDVGLKFEFVGTGFNIQGVYAEANNGTLRRRDDDVGIYVDGNLASGLGGSNIANQTGLSWGRHQVELKMGPTSNMTINTISINTGMSTNVTTLDAVPYNTQWAVLGDGSLNSFFVINETVANFTMNDDLLQVTGPLPNGTLSQWVTMNIPAGTAYIEIHGEMAPWAPGQVVMDFQPRPMEIMSGSAFLASTEVVRAPLYETPLDPDRRYSLGIVPTTNGTLSITHVVMFQGPVSRRHPPGQSHGGGGGGGGTNVGKIVGSVVGVVCGLLLIAAAFFLYRRHHKHKTAERVAQIRLNSLDHPDSKYIRDAQPQPSLPEMPSISNNTLLTDESQLGSHLSRGK